MKKVIVVGHQGQDGQFIINDLLKKNYSITGIGKKKLETYNSVWQDAVDITSYSSVKNLISQVKPDYIYFLAAYHHSSTDDSALNYELINSSFEINVNAYINFLFSIKEYSPKTKIFYASSCHIFGNPKNQYQNEKTEMKPESIYAITKMNGLLISNFFRKNYGIFSSVGILYNHESSLRKSNFVSKKIVNNAVRIKKGLDKKLFLGDIDVMVDWGYAGDFVIAMQKILDLEKSGNFIIATGKTTPLKDFVEFVFNDLNLDWRKYIEIKPNLIKRKPIDNLCGDYSKLSQMTGWSPKYGLKDIAEIMVKKEINE